MQILIVDFDAERLDLLTAAIQKFNIDYTIAKHGFDLDLVNFDDIGGVIFSGSPSCSFEPNAPDIDKAIYDKGVPILGICYGMQLTAIKFGGKVEKSPIPEHGATKIEFFGGRLSQGLGAETEHMTHYDYVTKVPEGFTVTGKSKDCPVASMENTDKNIYLVQFHPEFFISPSDDVIFTNFLFNICNFPRN